MSDEVAAFGAEPVPSATGHGRSKRAVDYSVKQIKNALKHEAAALQKLHVCLQRAVTDLDAEHDLLEWMLKRAQCAELDNMAHIHSMACAIVAGEHHEPASPHAAGPIRAALGTTPLSVAAEPGLCDPGYDHSIKGADPAAPLCQTSPSHTARSRSAIKRSRADLDYDADLVDGPCAAAAAGPDAHSVEAASEEAALEGALDAFGQDALDEALRLVGQDVGGYGDMLSHIQGSLGRPGASRGEPVGNAERSHRTPSRGDQQQSLSARRADTDSGSQQDVAQAPASHDEDDLDVSDDDLAAFSAMDDILGL